MELMDLQGICEPTLWNSERKSVCVSLRPLTPKWVHKAFIKIRRPQQRLRYLCPLHLTLAQQRSDSQRRITGLERRLDVYWLAGIGGACWSELIASGWLGRGWKLQWMCPAWRLSNQNKADQHKRSAHFSRGRFYCSKEKNEASLLDTY